jgi:hypothetical protein
MQILYIMHNTLASINYNKTRVSRFAMHQGLPYSKGKLGSVALDECCPPSSSPAASFSGGKPPMTIVSTCVDMPI